LHSKGMRSQYLTWVHHGLSGLQLTAAFWPEKATSKLYFRLIELPFPFRIGQVPWSDPSSPTYFRLIELPFPFRIGQVPWSDPSSPTPEFPVGPTRVPRHFPLESDKCLGPTRVPRQPSSPEFPDKFEFPRLPEFPRLRTFRTSTALATEFRAVACLFLLQRMAGGQKPSGIANDMDQSFPGGLCVIAPWSQ
jgi:hypothetical protein